MLDAGRGCAASRADGGGPFRGTILLSHLHWDHFQGLPFFAGGDHEDARVDLRLPEQEDGSGRRGASRAMSPPHFPISPTRLRGAWTFWSWPWAA